jgi:predicted neuraminidase
MACHAIGLMLAGLACSAADNSALTAEFVFPLRADHNHAPGIVALCNGDLLVSWYRGSGERRADDVAVYGARLQRGSRSWSEPFLLADTPGFPDCNTCMLRDPQGRIWLFWPTVLANSWESCLTNYRVALHAERPGPVQWARQGLILLKPRDFSQTALEQLDRFVAQHPAPLSDPQRAELAVLRERLSSRLYQRLGWQPRCKPTVLPSGRILLPLYSDTFSISIMAISDDQGDTWSASEPLIGWGNIQPSVLRRDDGTLVAYMRENGVTGRVRIAESRDDGTTWGPVGETAFPNSGSGLDGVRLANGHWVLVYNDSPRGRTSLAVSLSDDEGRTWRWTRHLERHDQGQYHYPAVIQGDDGRIHVIYSYFVADGKSMKHAAFDEPWIRQRD